LNAPTAAVNAATADAQAAQTVAAAAIASTFKQATPLHYKNKYKDMEDLQVASYCGRLCQDLQRWQLFAHRQFLSARQAKVVLSRQSMMLTRLPTKELSRLIPGSSSVRP
jgi:hypothetical protein